MSNFFADFYGGFGGSFSILRADTIMFALNVKIEGRIRFVGSVTTATDVEIFTLSISSLLLFDFNGVRL